jgi:hypothetical protein
MTTKTRKQGKNEFFNHKRNTRIIKRVFAVYHLKNCEMINLTNQRIKNEINNFFFVFFLNPPCEYLGILRAEIFQLKNSSTNIHNVV